MFPTTRAWGAPLPYTPSGTGCERVAPLSRSPGGCSFEGFVSDDVGYSFERFCFRRRECGALCSPTPPRVTGVREGCAPLALSRGCSGGEFCSRRSGSYFLTILVSDDTGYSFEGFCSRLRRAWGAPLPYILSRSPGVVLLKGLFLTKQVILLRTLFPTTRAWGAPLPYTPSGDGGARGL